MFKNPKPPSDPVLRCKMRIRALESSFKSLDRALAVLRREADKVREIVNARKSK